MTTALEIITDALREGNLIGIGVVPDAPKQTESLRRLNALISSALGYEIGEGLQDWLVGTTNVADSYLNAHSEQVWTRPPANVSLQLNSQQPQTIFLPTEVSDGARIRAIDMLGSLATYPVTLDANGLRIEGAASVTLSTNNMNRTWFYRADLGDWKIIADLEIGDDMPFPAEHDEAFVTLLAMRLNPRYGRAMSGDSGAWLQRSLGKLKARYRQKKIVPADLGVLNLTNTGFGYQGGDRRGPRGWMN